MTEIKFGARIKELRTKLGLTLDQLAEITGSSKSYIWELENKNPPRPSAEKLSKIAEELGVTVDYLFGRIDQSLAEAEDKAFFREYSVLPDETKQAIRQLARSLNPNDKSPNETPFKAAAKLTKILDTVDGEDRFDRGPVDVESLALEYSRQTCPAEPIDKVQGQPLSGCEGALVPSEATPRRWGILYNSRQNRGRKNFTIAHEFGHYLLHRHLADEGIYCDEESVIRRNGKGIEKEADEFAANLLMPLHDYRAQVPADRFATADDLSLAAKRYGVSLTAATLRWLEYTQVRAMMIVSNEGFVHWARSSDAAFKTRIYMQTRGKMNEMPKLSLAVSADFSQVQTQIADQAESVWYSEACREICVRSQFYDQEITVLQFEKARYRPFRKSDDQAL